MDGESDGSTLGAAELEGISLGTSDGLSLGALEGTDVGARVSACCHIYL